MPGKLTGESLSTTQRPSGKRAAIRSKAPRNSPLILIRAGGRSAMFLPRATYRAKDEIPSSPTFYVFESLGGGVFATALTSMVYLHRLGCVTAWHQACKAIGCGSIPNIHDCVFRQDLIDTSNIRSPIAGAPPLVSHLRYV